MVPSGIGMSTVSRGRERMSIRDLSALTLMTIRASVFWSSPRARRAALESTPATMTVKRRASIASSMGIGVALGDSVGLAVSVGDGDISALGLGLAGADVHAVS